MSSRSSGSPGSQDGRHSSRVPPTRVAAGYRLAATAVSSWRRELSSRRTSRQLQMTGQPGVHFGDAPREQRQVPVIVEQSGLGPGDMPGQPLAVRERHEHVFPPVHDHHRNADVSQRESPRLHHAVVLPPALTAQFETLACGVDEELGISPVSTAASAGVSSDFTAFAMSAAVAASISSRRESVLARAAASSLKNRRMSSTLSSPMPAK